MINAIAHNAFDLVKYITYLCDDLILTNLLEIINMQCALHGYYLFSLIILYMYFFKWFRITPNQN